MDSPTDDAESQTPSDTFQVWCSEFTAQIRTLDDKCKCRFEKETTLEDGKCTISLSSNEDGTVKGNIRFEFDNSEYKSKIAETERGICFERFMRCLRILGYKLLDPSFNEPKWENCNGRKKGIESHFYSRYGIEGKLHPFEEEEIQNMGKLLPKMKDDKPLNDMADHMYGKILTGRDFMSNWIEFNKLYRYNCKGRETDVIKKYIDKKLDIPLDLLVSRNKELFNKLSKAGITYINLKENTVEFSENINSSIADKNNKETVCHTALYAYNIRNGLFHEGKLHDSLIQEGKQNEKLVNLLCNFLFDLVHIDTIMCNGLGQKTRLHMIS